MEKYDEKLCDLSVYVVVHVYSQKTFRVKLTKKFSLFQIERVRCHNKCLCQYVTLGFEGPSSLEGWSWRVHCIYPDVRVRGSDDERINRWRIRILLSSYREQLTILYFYHTVQYKFIFLLYIKIFQLLIFLLYRSIYFI